MKIKQAHVGFFCSHAFCASQLILAINLHYPGSTQHFKRHAGLINIFKESLFTRCFQLCLSPACSSSPLPPKIFVCCMCPRLQYLLLFFFLTHSVFSLCSCRCRNDIYRGTLFRPLQFFCKVRYVNWPVLPFFQSSCMCCMCAVNYHHSLKSKPSNEKLLPSEYFTKSLAQCGPQDTNTFINDFHFTAINQILHWFMSFWESIDHFASF